MKNVTSKSTKAEIYDALEEIKGLYNKALSELKEAKTKKFDPVETKRVQAEKVTLQVAEETIDANILNETIINKYKSVKEAIAILEKKLKDLYGIEVEADTLAALQNAQVIQRDKTLRQSAEDYEEYQQKLQGVKDQITELKEEWNVESKEYTANRDKERKREEAEYAYTLSRTRKIEKDKYEDDKAAREKAIADKEIELNQREVSILGKEEELARLQGVESNLETVKATAREEGFAAGQEKAKTSYDFEVRTLKADFNSKSSIKDNTIEMLEKQVEKLTEEINEYKEELANARKEVKEIATATVQSAGNKDTVAAFQAFAKDLSSGKGNK